MVVEPIRPIKIFYCYAHEDKPLRDELGRHLGPLRRSGWIVEWHDQEIQPGTDWKQEINVHLDTADIVLLLISADFMDSDYCYSVEMQRALERHRAGEAHVIPIILRPTDWEETPIGGLQALPTGGKAVVLWPVRDEAFRNVVRGIRRVTELLRAEKERARKAQEGEAVRKAEPKPPMVVPPLYTPRPLKHGVSRRAVLAGLAGLAVAGSGIALIASHHGQNLPGPPGHTPTSTPHRTPSPAPSPSPTPTTIPLGSVLYTYRGHSSYVLTVAWSPDGKRIASGSNDHTVQVWNAANGENVYTYRGHSSYVLTVAWSPDGKRIASGSADQTVQVWWRGDFGRQIIQKITGKSTRTSPLQTP